MASRSSLEVFTTGNVNDNHDEDNYGDEDDLERNAMVHKKGEGREVRRRTRNKMVADDNDDDARDGNRKTTDGGAMAAPFQFVPGRCIFYTMVTMFCLSSVSIFLPSRYYQQHDAASVANHSLSSSMVNFTCPPFIRKSDVSTFVAEYVEVTKQLTNNMSQFAKEFRETNFDGWDRTYEQLKNGMYHWKSTRFTPLKSGDSIYESACGIGLNLYMTLEILQDVHNITNLVVYGNEHLKVSADKANAVTDQIAPAEASKGVICPGDSTNLSFVPSNAFDLVFTGYLSPILDPLHINLSLNENFAVYTRVCKEALNASAPSSNAQAIVAKAQDEQNHWYDTWVREMIRIAKPGKAVIVEHVSSAYCDVIFDWGGVSKEWWSTRILKWDIQPDSLYIEDDVIFPTRYHVYMRKKVQS